MKIALVCDFLTKLGGAQKVLFSLSELYPEAPIYCLLYDEKGTKGIFKNRQIVPSVLQKKPAFLRRRPKFLVGQFAKAVEQFDLSNYDVVISSNDSFAHGVVTKPETFHLCYCHTPTRYLWDWHSEYLKENNIGFGPKGMFVRHMLHKQRIWDRVSADRVDHWLANSENVKTRISKYYQADADVVYPPIETDKIKLSESEPSDYYVIASRLEPYKRIDLAILACNKLKKNLVIIGDGSQLNHLQSIAGPTITFLNWQTGDKLFKHIGHAKAFIFPGEDDFGIAPVEAMAAGRPVIAYKKGGTLETIIDGKTGIFFDKLTVESVVDAINKLESDYRDLKPAICRSQAEKFSDDVFKQNIREQVETGYKKHQEEMKK